MTHLKGYQFHEIPLDHCLLPYGVVMGGCECLRNSMLTIRADRVSFTLYGARLLRVKLGMRVERSNLLACTPCRPLFVVYS